ncbi:MAG: alpha-L-rhamnosidase C-terminal domain-containing protein, partial [Terriglobia bacterium]
QKGNRNQIEGKHILGYSDQFLPDGGSSRVFQPLWWRAYRYIKVDITTAAEPLELDDFYGEFTAYPFTKRASFDSDDPSLEKIMQVGWRTARLCAHETYMDCPYYEQLQYAGDTRIQALISLYMTGDDRLVKNAIECLNASRTSEGLTQSRFPSRLPQYIPPFSLYWIGMMHDLWWYRGDRDFLRPFLTNVRGVLAWYESRLAPSGLLGRLPWWDFVDWTTDFQDGVPPQEADGQSSILSLEFAAALQEGADLESAFGSQARASEDRALAARITRTVYHSCWDARRGLLADTPARQHFSQHATILGVLTGAIPATEQRSAMQRVLSDSSLTQCSYYFRFYLFQALQKAGLGDEIVSQLGPWRQMLALGLTTFAEKPEPTRSDCHAWSAHPDFDLLALVAGIQPATAGFGEVSIRPHLGPLKLLSASVPVPQGEVSVSYRLTGSRLTADVTLPQDLKGWFYWNDHRYALHGGAQRLAFHPNHQTGAVSSGAIN